MARITARIVNDRIKFINATLEKLGINRTLRMSPRNGYYGLDAYDRTTNRCLYNIECGSPADCLVSAEGVLQSAAVEIALKAVDTSA